MAGSDASGAMVALYPSPDVQSQLAVDGGEPTDELHVTLVYMPNIDPDSDMQRLIETVGQWAQDQSSLEGEISGPGYFTAGDTPVTYAAPDIPGLAEMRQSLVEALEANGFDIASNHGYTPHITIDYSQIPGYNPPNLPLSFDAISCTAGNARTDIPFGTADTMDDTPPDAAPTDEIGTYSMTDFPTLEACVNALMASVPQAVDGSDPTPSTAADVNAGGSFVIPVLLPENVDSGDGRTFTPGSLSTRDLPLPLLWQIQSDDGHDGSVVVGRIDSIDRIGDDPGMDDGDDSDDPSDDSGESDGDTDSGPIVIDMGPDDGTDSSGDGDDEDDPDSLAVAPAAVPKKISGLGNARGVFDTGPYGREAERLVRAKMLRGVSADLDQFKASVAHDDAAQLADGDDPDADGPSDEDTIENDQINVTNGRVMAATLVPKPAFQECYIMIVDPDADAVDDGPVPDGSYEEEPGADEAISSSLASIAASAAPVHPPKTWFGNPKLTGPTPLTVTDDGRVFGHIAAWNVDHIGMPMATRPPRSASNYAYFKTGVLRTAEGDDVAVGQLTLAGGHAPLTVNATAAVKHYDDTASAVADVNAGEDRYGIWVSGGLRPGVTAEQVRTLRASAPSGDWRPIRNRLELVAVCQVNVPGFPVARAQVASGQVTALVAAGARMLAELRDSPMRELSSRLELLERDELQRRRSLAAERMQPIQQARQAALVAAVEAAKARVAPSRERKVAEQAALVASAEAAKQRIAALRADGGVAPFVEAKHPRGDHGHFKDVLTHLTESLSGVTGAEPAHGAIGEAASKIESGDVAGAKAAGEQAKAHLDTAASQAQDAGDKAKLEGASSTLGDALNTLASAATDPGEGESFGDLPPETQTLLNTIFHQLTSKVDPSNKLDAGVEDLGRYIDGSKFMSPQAIADLIKRFITDRVNPA